MEFDYISNLNFKPKLLLAEDIDFLRIRYARCLRKIGFLVHTINDGIKLEEKLIKIKFNVILSDSDMPEMQGYDSVRNALEKGLIAEDVLILGMSDSSENQRYWRGLAHWGGFFDKDYATPEKFAKQVISHFYNFYKQPNSIWRKKMLKIK